VMNRVHPLVANDGAADSVEAVGALLAERLPELAAGARPAAAKGVKRAAKPATPATAPLGERLARNFVAYQMRARGDAVRMEIFRQALPRGVPLVQVPNLPGDIHDLSGLLLLHPHLFGTRAA